MLDLCSMRNHLYFNHRSHFVHKRGVAAHYIPSHGKGTFQLFSGYISAVSFVNMETTVMHWCCAEQAVSCNTTCVLIGETGSRSKIDIKIIMSSWSSTQCSKFRNSKRKSIKLQVRRCNVFSKSFVIFLVDAFERKQPPWVNRSVSSKWTETTWDDMRQTAHVWLLQLGLQTVRAPLTCNWF